MTEPVKFGTDGWRALVAEEFTFTNLRRVVQAYAETIRGQGEAGKPVVVGYDTRFLSKEFAQAAAEVLAGNRLSVWLTKDVSPTPLVSKSIVRDKLAGGLMITASHNPAVYNGLKIKGAYGGPAFPEFTNAVEARIGRQAVERAPEGSEGWKRHVVMVDLETAYLKELKQYLRMDWVRRGAGLIVVDPMHGAGCGYLEKILKGSPYRIQLVHGDRRPDFGGLHPEPIESNLIPLCQVVRKSRARAGLATDGDGDRLGVVDGRGHVVNSQQVMALLLWHLVKHRGWKGSVVKTNAVTVCLDRMAKNYGLPLRLTQIGFKYIANWIIQESVLIGGEESGGMSFQGYMPERDGVLASLLILEMMGCTKKPLHELVQQMEKEFGKFSYQRTDLRLSVSAKTALLEKLKGFHPVEFAGLKVREKTMLDGTKFMFENDSWLLFRLSGTEPLLRVYAEAPSKKIMTRLLKEGLQLVEEIQ